MITFDVETVPIAPGLQAPPLVCLAASDGTVTRWDEAEDVAAALLAGGDVLVGHGVAFDFAVLGAQFPRLLPEIFRAYDEGRVECTLVRAKLCDIAGGVYRGFVRTDGKVEKVEYSLDALARRHFDLALDKTTWRLRYAELRDVPIASWPEGARKYVLEDVYATAALWCEQEANRAYLADQHRQARSAFWLRLLSCWGIHTDARAVAELERTTRAEYERLARALVAGGLLTPSRKTRTGRVIEAKRNTGAAKARLVAAFARAGKPAPATDKGNEKLDEATCLASGDPLLAAYAEFSSLKKKLSTDLPLLASGAVVPIHARFEELLETGRTSSSPNIQNLPRAPGIRECFVPRPGFVFASADYSGLELRTVAQVCVTVLGHSRLAEVLNAGGDPHLQMAATILGCSYDEAKQRHKAGDEAADTARQVGKVANFGFPGGLGIASMVEYAAKGYGVILTEEQAATLKQQWLAAWPEFQDYFRWVGKLVDAPFPQIEQLYSGRFRGDVSYTEACNSFFQGLGADAAKAAGWLLARACYADTSSVLYGSRLVNFVHDEFIAEVPEELGHECAIELARLMREGAAPWLPDVPPEAEPLLMRRWSKKAKPKVENGRLVPWG